MPEKTGVVQFGVTLTDGQTHYFDTESEREAFLHTSAVRTLRQWAKYPLGTSGAGAEGGDMNDVERDGYSVLEAGSA